MARVAGNSMPVYPRGFIILRILQLILAIIILSLNCYAVYVAAFAGDCLMLMTATVTFIVGIWLVCCHSCAPQLYNYWAVLSFEIFLVLFWLISFAVLAAQTAYYWASGSGYCGYYYCYSGDLSGDDLVYGSILAAASGLGALEFLFFLISLIIHSVALCRHRRNGGRNKPNGSKTMPYKLQLQAQAKTDYEAVPQYGLPQNQDTAYNSQQTYNAPAPQQNVQQQQVPVQQQPTQQVTTPVAQFQSQNQAPVLQQQQQLFHQPVQQQPIQPQTFYPQQTAAPLVAQPTGASFVQQISTPPPQVIYQPPPPQPTPPPVQMAYQAPVHQGPYAV